MLTNRERQMYLAVWLSGERLNANHPRKIFSGMGKAKPVVPRESQGQTLNKAVILLEMSSRMHIQLIVEMLRFKLECFFPFLSGREGAERWFPMYVLSLRGHKGMFSCVCAEHIII